MTTATPSTETHRTVSVQGMRTYPLGETAVRSDAVVPGLGNVLAGFCIAGSCTAPYLSLTITGLALTTDIPETVLLQPRQSANQDFGWHDEFAVQVITTSASEMLVRIKRLDGDTGWGQDLRIDIFIVEGPVTE
jgi:hypothetical protein